MFRWLWENISTLAISFILALTVWVAAVLAGDPNQTMLFPEDVSIEYIGLAPELLIVNELPTSAQIVLRAPQSTWQQLSLDDLILEVDLSQLEADTYQIQLEPQLRTRLAQVISVEPASVQIELEASATNNLPVEIIPLGEPALGYQIRDILSSPESAIVLGPVSLVDSVISLQAEINIADRQETIERDEVAIQALDKNGVPVAGVQIQPANALIVVNIERLGGYRVVNVIPQLEGLLELENSGYRYAGVEVSPQLVTVFSSDPSVVESLPDFVNTIPLDISTATSDLERRLPLNLPEGLSLVGDQSVLVQVRIAIIEGSTTLNVPIEVQGLSTGLFVQLNPEVIDVTLSGPLPTLNGLLPEDVRVVLDLIDLGIGSYQIVPEVVITRTDITFEPIFPESIEVTITANPPTPTPSP